MWRGVDESHRHENSEKVVSMAAVVPLSRWNPASSSFPVVGHDRTVWRLPCLQAGVRRLPLPRELTDQ